MKSLILHTRRSLLAATLSAGPLIAVAGTSSINGKQAQRLQKFDTGLPTDNLYGLAKIAGSTDGSTTCTWLGGRIYSKLADAKLAEPFLDWEGVQLKRFLFESATRIRYVFRGAILFKGLGGEYLDEFENPITGQRNKVNHFFTQIGTYDFTTEGIVASSRFNGFLAHNPSPLLFTWQVLGDDIWLELDERVRYTPKSTGKEIADNAIFRFGSSLSDVKDRSKVLASACVSYSTQLPFYDWMGMRGVDGYTLWSGAGRKYASIAEFPQERRQKIERLSPGFFTASLGD
jgi:hypothetical protein